FLPVGVGVALPEGGEDLVPGPLEDAQGQEVLPHRSCGRRRGRKEGSGLVRLRLRAPSARPSREAPQSAVEAGGGAQRPPCGDTGAATTSDGPLGNFLSSRARPRPVGRASGSDARPRPLPSGAPAREVARRAAHRGAFSAAFPACLPAFFFPARSARLQRHEAGVSGSSGALGLRWPRAALHTREVYGSHRTWGSSYAILSGGCCSC
uniref:Uncharacterized protein n=1 Tax=Anolis carolinensis TaxID=28377 RepID=A0A803STE5_ANOCA